MLLSAEGFRRISLLASPTNGRKCCSCMKPALDKPCLVTHPREWIFQKRCKTMYLTPLWSLPPIHPNATFQIQLQLLTFIAGHHLLSSGHPKTGKSSWVSSFGKAGARAHLLNVASMQEKNNIPFLGTCFRQLNISQRETVSTNTQKVKL